jgi:hypothetical protein
MAGSSTSPAPTYIGAVALGTNARAVDIASQWSALKVWIVRGSFAQIRK